MSLYQIETPEDYERDGIVYNNTSELKKLSKDLKTEIVSICPEGCEEGSIQLSNKCIDFIKKNKKVVIIDYMKDGTANLLMRESNEK